MTEKFYLVVVKLGLQTTIRFRVQMKEEDVLGTKLFVECDREGIVNPHGGLVAIESNLRRITMSYNAITVKLDVMKTKEVDDNYHFKCVTDLFRADVYICEECLWRQKEEAIFF